MAFPPPFSARGHRRIEISLLPLHAKHSSFLPPQYGQYGIDHKTTSFTGLIQPRACSFFSARHLRQTYLSAGASLSATTAAAISFLIRPTTTRSIRRCFPVSTDKEKIFRIIVSRRKVCRFLETAAIRIQTIRQ